MFIETGNLVVGNYPIFCHQVNCRGVMGAGIAKQIREKYPEVFETYRIHCMTANYLLGTILPVFTHDNRICINMFAQDGYGRTGVWTDYDAFKNCLYRLENFLKACANKQNFRRTYGSRIYFPYNIGCGNAGGDWNTVLALLQEFENKVGDAWIVNIVKLN